ncbi:hypothetical protein GCM10007857_32490 [Bradyrhizobium iriomotense]|uniref:Tyr recombinase domain-containing protein n=2 Tax=Bradyrhizobium iriomotense TaxID=441950 RepID=A0ABQ6AYD1_9BRAD|nr:hypothetical protein GCM10007857_32490 [Bradyrhizobium iriomotense]
MTPAGLDLEAGTANLITLKRRKRGVIRQVPLPSDLLSELDRTFGIRDRQRYPPKAQGRIWNWSRSTAWRRVKEVMAEAEVMGLAASPKGLRHAFGVAAFQSSVPPHLVQRWFGHASLRTTGIYCDVSGPDERRFAERMWANGSRWWLGSRAGRSSCAALIKHILRLISLTTSTLLVVARRPVSSGELRNRKNENVL